MAILQQIAKEKKGIVGALAKTAVPASSLSASNPVSAVQNARKLAQNMQNQHRNTDNATIETKQPVSIDLKSPKMSADIIPFKGAQSAATRSNPKQLYVQKAA